MFSKKVRFVLLMPLMTLAGTNGNPELHSVTPQYMELHEPFYDPHHNRLLFVARRSEKFCAYYLDRDNTTCTSAEGQTGTIVPVAETPDQFAVGIGPYFGLLKWDVHSHHSSFSRIRSAQADGCGDQMFTLGDVDEWGRFWAGTQGQNGGGEVLENEGNLYRYNKDKCNLKTAIERVTVSHGVTWDLRSTKMYVIGCDEYRVDMYHYDKSTGEISNRQTFLDFKARRIEGQPRGLTTDSDGNIWMACYNGWQVIKVHPYTGEVLETIKLPVAFPTNVVFGGPHYEKLFITTSRYGLSPEEEHHQPKAGTVLCITGLKERGQPRNQAVLCRNEHGHHQTYEHDEDCCMDSEEDGYPSHHPLSCC